MKWYSWNTNHFPLIFYKLPCFFPSPQLKNCAIFCHSRRMWQYRNHFPKGRILEFGCQMRALGKDRETLKGQTNFNLFLLYVLPIAAKQITPKLRILQQWTLFYNICESVICWILWLRVSREAVIMMSLVVSSQSSRKENGAETSRASLLWLLGEGHKKTARSHRGNGSIDGV